MSTRRHQTIGFPQGNLDKLRALVRGNMETWAKLAGLNPKTLLNANKKGIITRKSFAELCKGIGYDEETLERYLKALAFSPEQMQEANHREKIYSKSGQNELGRDIALHAYSNIEFGDDGNKAYWAERIASNFRSLGALEKSLEFYRLTEEHIKEHVSRNPLDWGAMLTRGIAKFGRIIVEDHLIASRFDSAYDKHESLLADCYKFMKEIPCEDLQRRVWIGRLHIIRQQARMSLLRGKYSLAYEMGNRLLDEYEYHPLEAASRHFTELLTADALRQLGQPTRALWIYDKIASTADSGGLGQLLSFTLIRSAAASQATGSAEKYNSCIQRINTLRQLNSKFLFTSIYSRLVRYSKCDGAYESTMMALDNIIEGGRLSETFAPLEFAHITLCKAELLRREEMVNKALGHYRTAFECYCKMPCNWGAVRAFAGIKCIDKSDICLPPEIINTLEGGDLDVFKQIMLGRSFAPGSLSMNLP